MPDQPSDDTVLRHPAAHRPEPSTATSTPPTRMGPFAATFPADAALPFDVVSYGPDIPTERAIRLLGNLEGKRVLELGCGAGQAAIAMARQGAKVISVEPDAHRIEQARINADRAEVRLEIHHADLAEIAFIRADGIDVAVSIYALANAEDLDRVFRQAHRVLRTECPLVFSVPHPAFAMVDPASSDPLRLKRPYFDRTPRSWSNGDHHGTERPRTLTDLFTSLSRANFRVDTLLEPEPEAEGPHSRYWTEIMKWVPSTLVLRARKEGL